MNFLESGYPERKKVFFSPSTSQLSHPGVPHKFFSNEDRSNMETLRSATITPPRKIAQDPIEDEVEEETCSRCKFALVGQDMETTQDELKAMLKVEAKHYTPPRNYLAFDSCKSGVSENWRRRLCEWMFEVTDHYDFDREVVSFAFDFLDRSVSLAYGPGSDKKLSKRDFQLYAVTSLYLAIKVHGEMDSDVEGKRIKLRISAFEELSRGCFMTDAIEKKEIEFLTLFQWRINPPTCARFIYSYLHLLPEWSQMEFESSREDIICQIFDVAKYLTELSIFVSEFSFNFSPSKIAYAAMLCAFQFVEKTNPMPYHIKVRFLMNAREASGDLTPESEDVRRLETMLKKLAPKMFPNTISYHPLPRTVSFLEVDPTQSKTRTTRSISPILMGQDEPKRKRQKV